LLAARAQQCKQLEYTWDKGATDALILCEIAAAMQMAGVVLDDKSCTSVGIVIDHSTTTRGDDQLFAYSTLEVSRILRKLGVACASIFERSGDDHDASSVATLSVYENGHTANLVVYANCDFWRFKPDTSLFSSVVNTYTVTHLRLEMTCNELAPFVAVFNSTPCLRALHLRFNLTCFSGAHAPDPLPKDADPYLEELSLLRVDVTGVCTTVTCNAVKRVLSFVCSRAPNITTFLTDLHVVPKTYNTVITQWLHEMPISPYTVSSHPPGPCDFAALLPNVMRIGLLYVMHEELDKSHLVTTMGTRLCKTHPRLLAVTHPATRDRDRDRGVTAFYDKKRLRHLAAWQKMCLGVALARTSSRTGVPVAIAFTAQMIRDYIGDTGAELALVSFDANADVHHFF
jgi:hypothetical protein